MNLLNIFDYINDFLLGWLYKIIENLPVYNFIKDALIDSLGLLPFLFIIFILIEIFENYFSQKAHNIPQYSKNLGPLIGAILASLPQCGFSVIATILYLKRTITRGTLIAVYISTSDEAIPVLLTQPGVYKEIIPIIIIKVFLGIITGYIVDFFSTNKLVNPNDANKDIDIDDAHGCCNEAVFSKMKSLIYHPLKHTFNIFIFILIITLLLNIVTIKFESTFEYILLSNSVFQPITASLIGLIPNCAISVLFTMLYIKHQLLFASLIAGLSANAGFGLLVLFKNNHNLKDSLKIIAILFSISCFIGITFFFLSKTF